MTRWLLFPLLLVLVACGGGGSLFGSDAASFPYQKQLTFRMSNTSGETVNMYLDPETADDSNLVAAGAARSVVDTFVWLSEDEVIEFVLSVKSSAGVATARVPVTGRNATAENFAGFDVQWNGSSLSVQTGGSVVFPLTKSITLKATNKAASAANLCFQDEVPSAANLVAPGATREQAFTTVWASESDLKQFAINVFVEGVPKSSFVRNVSGTAAASPTFGGYQVKWDGVSLTEDKGTSTYPLTKNLSVEFRNDSGASGSTATMWIEPEENADSAPILSPGESRTAIVPRTWQDAAASQTFNFYAKVGASIVGPATLTVNGAQATAVNFSGFVVKFTPTGSLTAETK